MTQILAHCGLDCAECPAYIGTQTNDMALLEKTATEWQTEYAEYASAPITVESILCDGCTTEGRKCANCAECPYRTCSMGRGLENCAYCTEYPCEMLTGFLQVVPQAKARLDAVRLIL